MSDDDLDPYAVFVQWQRGKPHEYAETVTAPDREMAIMFAKRNVDVRGEPVSIWVVPHDEITKTRPDNTTLVPRTDRGYRTAGWYAQHRIAPEAEER